MNPEGTRIFSSPYAIVLLIVSGEIFPAKEGRSGCLKELLEAHRFFERIPDGILLKRNRGLPGWIYFLEGQ